VMRMIFEDMAIPVVILRLRWMLSCVMMLKSAVFDVDSETGHFDSSEDMRASSYRYTHAL